MTTRRKWTNEEEQVLISQVRQSPNNLAKAFRATSEIIERSTHCVEQHWYTKTRHSEAIFMTVSANNTISTNQKNVLYSTNDNTHEVVSIWRRLLRFLGL